jgi:proline iminopeptidase
VSFKTGLKYFVIFAASAVLASAVSAYAYRYIARRAIENSRAIRTPDGIEWLEAVNIGGIDQWIEVRGESTKNPILLFIHGGPGSSFMPVARAFQGPWEKYFTVVQWDQRGAGKTYSSNSKDVQQSTITMDQMNADTLEVVNYLRKRFSQDKIFVLGHSWGSILGLRLAHDHPELLYAYLGVGQATNGRANEEALYQESMAEAQRTQNKQAIEELTSIAPYPSPGVTFKQIRIMREWSGELIGPKGVDDAWMGPKAIFLAPEYSLVNDADWFRGQLFSVNALLPALAKMDFAEYGYGYRGPIFFLEGRHDPYTPSSVAQKFFDKVNDPQKEFVWFENSGHFPFSEEAGKFTDVLVQKVLPLAAPARPQ